MRAGDFLARLASLGLRWPRLVVAVCVAATALAVLELRVFRLEPDVSRLLPQGREVRLFRELEQRTAGGRTLLVAVHGSGQDEVEQRLARIAVELRGSPFLADVQATREELLGAATSGERAAPLWQMDAATLGRLQTRLTTGRRDALERMLADLASDPIGGRDLATNDPLGLREVFADVAATAMPVPLAASRYVVLGDGRAGILRLVGARPPFDADFARDLLDDVERRVGSVPHEMWGGYVVAREQAAQMRHDMVWSSVSSALFVGLYLAMALGSFFAAPLVLMPTVLAVVWALPLGSVLFGPFNVIAVGAAAVLIGLGVDFGIHFLARYAAERQGAPHAAAVLASARGVGLPILLGALTTCGAFLSLALGEFGGLAGFGALLSLGLGLAVLLVFVCMPIMLGWRGAAALRPPRSSVAAALERWAGRRSGAGFGVALGLLGLAGFGMAATRGLSFDVDADALSARTSAAGEVRVRIESQLGFSPIPATILLDPEATAGLDAGLTALRRAGAIVFADGPQHWLRPPAQAPAVAALREATRGFVASTLDDLTELGFDAAQFEPGLRRFERMLAADPGPVPERYVLDLEGRRRFAVYCYTPRTLRSEAAWRDFTSAVGAAFGPDAEPFGSFSLLAEVRRLLLHDLRTCALATALLVVVCTLSMTRGHWLGWLALAPVLVGTGVTVGVLVVFGVPLNLANFVAIPFLLGIGVDDGIHLASHYRQRGRGAPLRDTGIAIWRTSVTTALAFGSLLTSSTRGLSSLGLIALVGVTSCYLASVFVMLPIARRFAPPQPSGGGSRVT